ncbi:HlyD family efflux transporter periplasmic adaptor subunit [uncultured Tenacibaculum sp.]|uniref:HlyD family secretion protein n=1 Tax=uncultured Tenacibaculum sp. TaxID=174713 RepID=UPI002604C41C|nr:HlyD family efflux transporter periplasmic adaptor subunit [uncultured Tenacibaculum sp.]
MPQNNHLDNIELRSEEVQEILTKVPHWMIRWGNSLFLVLVLMLLLLSWLIKYPDIITSEALITTKIPPQKAFAKVTGKIDTILVKDTQEISEGTPIAFVENTANYEDVLYLKSVIDTIILKKDSFSFPFERIPLLFLGDIENAYANFENNYIQYILNKQLQPYSNEAIANNIIASELKRRLQNLKSQKQINKTELGFKNKGLERSKSLFEKGVISAKDYEAQQLGFLQAERNYQNMNSSISQLREAIANSTKTSKGNEIIRIREEMTLLKNTIQSFNLLKKTIKDWELKYAFISKISGTVSFLNYWNENQTVTQGDLVFTVIPSKHSAYIAKLKTPSLNSGKIAIGQRVNVKLENYPDYEFGVLKGIVNNISVVSDKEGFYTIDVLLPEKLVTSYDKEIEFKHEMRGTAEIITEDLRLIERFFNQFRKVLSR